MPINTDLYTRVRCECVWKACPTKADDGRCRNDEQLLPMNIYTSPGLCMSCGYCMDEEMDERAPIRRQKSAIERAPEPPAGYAACRVHDGTQDLWAQGASSQVTHLVLLDEQGSNGGRPTLCGLTRFARDGQPPDIPGWSMGGGVSGPSITQIPCPVCFKEAS